ncbi:hypothetical protein [Salinarimonas ramus]|uniref:Uncharacterized protein n=1 Tax=Salinarimonas ramus TaxID=690164 RepID=A0A917Q6G2_9HYPH|nr:hypothetical protein [Salinarimonas ramus]GGK30051.1 hypothetical protein GCM10011322_15690 [Salinarimonas ramus]
MRSTTRNRYTSFAKLTPVVAILALAACGEETTTAEAPVIEDEAIVEQDTAVVEDTAPVVEEDTAAVVEEPVETETDTEVTVIEPETTTGAATETETAGTEIEPIVEDTGEAEVTVITPEGGDTQTTAQAGGTTGTGTDTLSTAGEATGAISATTAAMVEPGTYTSDQLSLELAEGGTFSLTGPDGNAVEGDWRVFDQTLTLSNASGATGDASFPMTCNITEEGEGFRISAETSSCEMLDGQVFQPQG